MDAFDLKLFRRTNRLTQLTIAEFLGATRSFVSQVENGKVNLPYDKKEMLINNDRG